MERWASRALTLVFAAGLIVTTGCTSGAGRQDQILDQLANLDKETIYEQAEELFQDKEYARARELFAFVYDSFPNDPLGHKAALRVADTFAVKKDVTNLTEARLRYRDFANRYPNDPDRDYALLKVGDTYSARRMRPDRDLSDIREALAAYQQLIAIYPDSPYAPEAETRINELNELLAEHEWLVAKFYLRNKHYLGALWRLQYARENFENYSRMDEVNRTIEEIETLIEDRDMEWKKRIEELKKEAED